MTYWQISRCNGYHYHKSLTVRSERARETDGEGERERKRERGREREREIKRERERRAVNSYLYNAKKNSPDEIFVEESGATKLKKPK